MALAARRRRGMCSGEDMREGGGEGRQAHESLNFQLI